MVSDSSSSSSSYTDDMVFGAFAQWTRRCLHVVTSFVGQLRRRRYVPTTDMNGMPVLPMIDNAHGYCLLICSADGSLGEYGYRAVGFNSLLETVRRDIERDERNRKRKRNRKPCTCASRMLNCEDADSCECRQLGGKKCIVGCHGDDHRSCYNAASHNKKKRKEYEGQQPIQHTPAFPTLFDLPRREVIVSDDSNHPVFNDSEEEKEA